MGDCRRTTGSAFKVGVCVRADSLHILSGRVKGYTKNTDRGNLFTREFCPECGSPLFTRSPAHAEFVFIKAGSLDDPEVVKPEYQIWVGRQVSWAHIDPDLPSFPKNRPASETDTAKQRTERDCQ